MNASTSVGEMSAPMAIGLGLLTCFLGYRLLKLTLGIMGAITGAGGGWAVGWSVAPGNSGLILACAVVGAIIGIVLYLWLFYLGLFLLGASCGGIVAAALLNAAGSQPQPVPVLAVALVFGMLALLMRKSMIIVSTAFSGSYLVAAGLFHLISNVHARSPLWLDPAQAGSPGVLGYVFLVFWLFLGAAGASFQNRAHRKRTPATRD